MAEYQPRPYAITDERRQAMLEKAARQKAQREDLDSQLGTRQCTGNAPAPKHMTAAERHRYRIRQEQEEMQQQQQQGMGGRNTTQVVGPLPWQQQQQPSFGMAPPQSAQSGGYPPAHQMPQSPASQAQHTAQFANNNQQQQPAFQQQQQQPYSTLTGNPGGLVSPRRMPTPPLEQPGGFQRQPHIPQNLPPPGHPQYQQFAGQQQQPQPSVSNNNPTTSPPYQNIPPSYSGVTAGMPLPPPPVNNVANPFPSNTTSKDELMSWLGKATDQPPMEMAPPPPAKRGQQQAPPPPSSQYASQMTPREVGSAPQDVDRKTVASRREKTAGNNQVKQVQVNKLQQELQQQLDLVAKLKDREREWESQVRNLKMGIKEAVKREKVTKNQLGKTPLVSKQRAETAPNKEETKPKRLERKLEPIERPVSEKKRSNSNVPESRKKEQQQQQKAERPKGPTREKAQLNQTFMKAPVKMASSGTRPITAPSLEPIEGGSVQNLPPLPDHMRSSYGHNSLKRQDLQRVSFDDLQDFIDAEVITSQQAQQLWLMFSSIPRPGTQGVESAQATTTQSVSHHRGGQQQQQLSSPTPEPEPMATYETYEELDGEDDYEEDYDDDDQA